MQSQIWAATIPLEITHPSASTSYIISWPRISYLPLLIPRLRTFFDIESGTFTHEDVLLKNLPLGLLFDLYQPEELPWKLQLDDGVSYHIYDAYMNSVKEADFVRNKTSRGVMSMSKEQSQALWNSVQDNDFMAFHKINSILLNPAATLKNIPLRVYIPSSPSASATLGSFKVMQSLVSPMNAANEQQTIGSALNVLLPSLFPSRRDAVLAEPVLHGAPVPFRAPLVELIREVAYADGWLHLCVRMLN